MLPGAGDEHLLAILGFAAVKRRSGEVDDQLRTGEREIGGRGAGLPDVLADRRADEHVAAPKEQQLAPCSEIAVLVEDAIVRQELLPVDPAQLTVREDGARVCKVTVEERAPDERRDALCGLRDLVERGTRTLRKPGRSRRSSGG